MSFLDSILARSGLDRPDGRPLHAYVMTDDEFRSAGEALARWSSRYGTLPEPLFTLWASERIRRDFESGSLSWDFVMAPLGLSGNRQTGVALTEKGLAFWKRPLRQRPGDGSRLFLYSLMAEGGLPDAVLARASNYAAAVSAKRVGSHFVLAGQ